MIAAARAVDSGPHGRIGPQLSPTVSALTHLDMLEAETAHIFREVAGEFDRSTLLFSGGKDSIVMLHVALKAFAPAPLPFSLLHVDTGHNFPEVLAYRDRIVEKHGLRLDVASVQSYIDDGTLRERPDGTRNPLQTLPLLDAVRDGRFGAVFGGGRRDEEKARAKERVFSLRDEFGAWDPRRQRPELWQLYDGHHQRGEHVRVFRCPTGPSWTSGSTSSRKTSNCPRSASRTGGRCSSKTAWGRRPATGAAPGRANLSVSARSGTARSATCPAPARSTRRLRRWQP